MSTEIVARAKADILAAGIPIDGIEGAFKITNLAATRLGFGVLDKPTGSHAEVGGQSYAFDIVVARDGRAWDVVVDGGASNTPAWNSIAPVDPSRYRDPVPGYPLGTVVTPPPPPPPPDGMAADIHATAA